MFKNRPFAQLLPGLETGHPVTVVSHLHMILVFPTSRKLFFLSPFWTVLSASHVQVTDRPSPDVPSLTQANNCANGLLIDDESNTKKMYSKFECFSVPTQSKAGIEFIIGWYKFHFLVCAWIYTTLAQKIVTAEIFMRLIRSAIM